MDEVRILLPQHKEQVMALARASLSASDEMEREMASWNARWRGEALDHYLPQGWSFGVFSGENLKAFVLAQPYLFHRGLTQTLWVECLQAPTIELSSLLLETVYRWARDKHFQCVLLEDIDLPIGFARSQKLTTPLLEIRSAKF